MTTTLRLTTARSSFPTCNEGKGRPHSTPTASYSEDGDRTGPGWSEAPRPTGGFRVRHPLGRWPPTRSPAERRYARPSAIADTAAGQRLYARTNRPFKRCH